MFSTWSPQCLRHELILGQLYKPFRKSQMYLSTASADGIFISVCKRWYTKHSLNTNSLKTICPAERYMRLVFVLAGGKFLSMFRGVIIDLVKQSEMELD